MVGAAEVLSLLVGRAATLAVAESLTGGLIGAAFTSVSGSSKSFRGGVISYATDLKHRLLEVPAELLAGKGLCTRRWRRRWRRGSPGCARRHMVWR